MNSDDRRLLQQEPVRFIEMMFKESLWSKQVEIANSVRDHTYTSVRSCHGSGKSRVSADIAHWFLYAFPYSKVITTAPTFRQVTDILWQEMRSAHHRSVVELGGKLTSTRLDVDENWFAIGLSTDDPDRFVGYHAPYILIIADEAFGISEPIFEAIEGVASTGFVRILYIGNPTAVAGTAYQSFRLPNVNKIHISAFDTPNFTEFGITLEDIRNNTWKEKITSELPRPYLISPEWVADKFTKWGEGTPMWDVRVMGDFPRQGDKTLIPLSKIEAAAMRNLTPQDSDPSQTGADVARFGVDKTVFCHRKGPKVVKLEEYAHMELVETQDRLYDFISRHPFGKTLVDEVGVGAGVVPNMIAKYSYKSPDLEHRLEGVNVGVAANDQERFFNLRAEIFWNLRERFINDDIDIPDDDELKSQLAAIEFEYTPKGQIKLESKEDMKKRGLPSPDKADALALAFGSTAKKTGLLEFMAGFKQA